MPPPRKSRRDPLVVPPEAIDKYREFHRYDPKDVGLMPSLRVPTRLHKAGNASWVIYRSRKTDPETLQKPRAPIDYIHEHDAGVHLYVPEGQLDTDVPGKFRDPDMAYVKLGELLGFAYVDPAISKDVIEAEGTKPLPELYCTPDGHALLVIQSKRTVLAMMWGGALGVFARGIDG